MKLSFVKARKLRNDPLLRFRDEISLPIIEEGYISFNPEKYVGIAGDFKSVPVLSKLKENEDFLSFVLNCEESAILFSIEKGKVSSNVSVPSHLSALIFNAIEDLSNYGGSLKGDGSLVLDLKSDEVGPHYAVNLLIGDRLGYKEPLLSTPKSVVGALGEGSFRGPAAYQILASRFDIRPEESGNPFNRQFYLIKAHKVVFYSGRINEDVLSSYVEHKVNETHIHYLLKNGLDIERVIFIYPQKEGFPEGVEIQMVNILSPTEAEYEICFTGMFGFSNSSCMENDVIYQTVIQEGSALFNEENEVVAISPHYYPHYFTDKVRFFGFKDEEGYASSFTENASSFLKGGSLENPLGIYELDNTLQYKGASFFALKKKIHLSKNKTKHVFSYTGYVENDEEDALRKKIGKFLEQDGSFETIEQTRLTNEEAFNRYSSYLQVKTGDKNFDALINRNLVFQNRYQSFVSRSFALTQKGYREIGFREVQDLYASIPYFVSSGEGQYVKEMLSSWIKNVYRFGYSNHNFYYVGKEPGQCSDDSLWLVEAIMQYIDETGEANILDEEFEMADGGKRVLKDTIKAIIAYSGEISVGKHHLPLLDLADWNDCLKIDADIALTGPEKEKLYREQIKKGLIKEGDALISNGSESVMNAFLLLTDLNLLLDRGTLFGEDDIAYYSSLKTRLEKDIRSSSYIEGYYARVLLNRDAITSYVGSVGDKLSNNEYLENGSIYLNSFSWSVISDLANEEEIASMIEKIDHELKTEVGYRLVSESDLTKVGTKDSATSHYFPGDRENGGVFKHAAMMFVESLFLAAKKVKDEALKAKLLNDAYFMLSQMYPYKTLEHPYLTKGNPRFCTQYANPLTKESIGPMLSGTATWALLSLKEAFGISFLNQKEEIIPLLDKDMGDVEIHLRTIDNEIDLRIHKKKGAYAFKRKSMIVDEKEVKQLNFASLRDKTNHRIEIQME